VVGHGEQRIELAEVHASTLSEIPMGNI
jgi:hypothetical protein